MVASALVLVLALVLFLATATLERRQGAGQGGPQRKRCGRCGAPITIVYINSGAAPQGVRVGFCSGCATCDALPALRSGGPGDTSAVTGMRP